MNSPMWPNLGTPPISLAAALNTPSKGRKRTLPLKIYVHNCRKIHSETFYCPGINLTGTGDSFSHSGTVLGNPRHLVTLTSMRRRTIVGLFSLASFSHWTDRCLHTGRLVVQNSLLCINRISEQIAQEAHITAKMLSVHGAVHRSGVDVHIAREPSVQQQNRIGGLSLMLA